MRKIFYIILSTFIVGFVAVQYVLFKKLKDCDNNIYKLKQEIMGNQKSIEVSKYVFEYTIKDLYLRIRILEAGLSKPNKQLSVRPTTDLFYLEQRLEKLEKIVGVKEQEYYLKGTLDERIEVVEQKLKQRRWLK